MNESKIIKQYSELTQELKRINAALEFSDIERETKESLENALRKIYTNLELINAFINKN